MVFHEAIESDSRTVESSQGNLPVPSPYEICCVLGWIDSDWFKQWLDLARHQ
jgi:hypothetical protein